MEVKGKIKIGILYICFYNLLMKRFGSNRIRRKEIFCELGRHFLVPKSLRDKVIQEMEIMGLLQRADRDNIDVMKSKLDVENYPHQFFKEVGLLDKNL